MTITTTFDISQMVTLRHDPDNVKRMITGISVRHTGAIQYLLAIGEKDSWHYDFEIMLAIDNERKVGFNK